MTTAKEFTVVEFDPGTSGEYADNSRFGYMIEGVDLNEVNEFGVEKWVEEYVQMMVSEFASSNDFDKDVVYKEWRSGGEFEQIVNWLNNLIAQDTE